MYFASIKPIMDLSRDVIDLAIAGDIAGARKSFDRVRAMRARMRRSVQSDKLEVAKRLSVEKGVRLAPDESELPKGLTEEQLAVYAQHVSKLDESLQTIRDWLKSSTEAFSIEELFASEEGRHLLLDFLLPEVWDFTQDIAVLCDSDAHILHPALVERGQKKFVILCPEEAVEDLQRDFNFLKGSAESTESTATICWCVDTPPDQKLLHHLVGDEVPVISLISHEISRGNALEFENLARFVSQSFLGHTSLKEWPVIFIEQWLGQLHHMFRFRSAIDLKQNFRGRHILIASPGPSLTESLEQLKKVCENFVVLAPIRSLAKLLSEGVVPDFALHVDATDFSSIVPNHSALKDVSLICFDHSHPSVWAADFRSVHTLPEPHIIGSSLIDALHGPLIPQLPGGSVSVVAAELAAAFDAASITLVGQDLSTSKGQYVGDSHEPKEDLSDRALTCKGINGERLKTEEDYLWFIGEFEATSIRYADHIELYNCTAFGAYLEGWTHIPLDQHPLLKGQETKANMPMPSKWDGQFETARSANVLAALGEESGLASKAAQICDDLEAACNALINEHGNDVSAIEELEARLQKIVSSKGSLLHFYTSRYSVALSAAVKSVQSLQENLSVSAEYYHQLAPRARKLAQLLNEASDKIQAELVKQVKK